MVTSVQIVNDRATVGRKLRKPKHHFNLKARPFHIQPCLIAPVLAGETLQSALLQARIVSDPIKDPLIGWWAEYYIFYVKHRDMDARATITAAHLDGTTAMPVLTGSRDGHYTLSGSASWVQNCLYRVVDTYFRDEPDVGTASNTSMRDPQTAAGLPLAYINNESWLESAKDETFTPPGHAPDDLPGEGDVPPDLIAGYETAYAQWQHMRALKVFDASFEDYLRAQGVKPATKEPEELYKPELIRYVRDWTYPSNTVDPVTGAPSSACSWSISERADKARFFAEPGFIFAVQVIRPKVYLSSQVQTASVMLTDAYSWLPAVLDEEPYTSLKKFEKTAGPLANKVDNGYWVDIKDLFLYGDQFVNWDLSTTVSGNLVALPSATMQKRVPPLAALNGFFKDAAANKVRSDGIVQLEILSRLRETT